MYGNGCSFRCIAGSASYTAAAAAAEFAESDAGRISNYLNAKAIVSWFSHKPSVTFSFIHTCSNKPIAGIVCVFPTTTNTSVFVLCYFSN